MGEFFGMGDIKETNRKQVAPLDLQKFLSEYSENQKWTAHNMLRPSSPPLRGRASRRDCLWVATRREKPPEGKP